MSGRHSAHSLAQLPHSAEMGASAGALVTWEISCSLSSMAWAVQGPLGGSSSWWVLTAHAASWPGGSEVRLCQPVASSSFWRTLQWTKLLS